ncbi:MAG: Kae1-associated kinase Bud32 [Candidatus Lokiarchaeota archaeon]|jgi:TP53 regulating kinase-like protein
MERIKKMAASNLIYREKLIRKGAEANIYEGYWFGKKVIFKHRVKKEYREDKLDSVIRTNRTLNEGRTLIKAKEEGINVPQVYEIDTENSIIIIKYIEGQKLKELMPKLENSEKVKLFHDIGQQVARLHINGHIHGDITTSNIIVTIENQVFLIDFGLHEYSDSIEDKSVDLHLFKRVLISSHGSDFIVCFNAFLDGYGSEYELIEKNESKSIIKNITAIERRGRYVRRDKKEFE